MSGDLLQRIENGRFNGRLPDPIPPVDDVPRRDSLNNSGTEYTTGQSISESENKRQAFSTTSDYSSERSSASIDTTPLEVIPATTAYDSVGNSPQSPDSGILSPSDSQRDNSLVTGLETINESEGVDETHKETKSPSVSDVSELDIVDSQTPVSSESGAERRRRVTIGDVLWLPALETNVEEIEKDKHENIIEKDKQDNIIEKDQHENIIEMDEHENSPATQTVAFDLDGTKDDPSQNGSIDSFKDVSNVRRNTVITQFPWLNDCLPPKFANGKQRVSKHQFVNFFGRSEKFSNELFIVFDSDESGAVSKREVMGALGKLKCRPVHEISLEKLDEIFSSGGDAYNEYNIEQFKKVWTKSKHALKYLFELFDYDGNGNLTTTEMHRSLEKISCMDNNAKLLAWMDEQFTKIAGEKRSITKSEFKKALNAKNAFFVDRIFNMLDTDDSGSLELVELIDGIASFISGDRSDKMKFLFKLYDADNSGSIDREEIKTYLKNCLDESGLQIPPYQFERLVSVVFDDADEDNSGSITFEEMQAQLEKHPMFLDDLSLSAGNWLRPTERPKKKAWKRPKIFTKSFLRNNVSSIVFWIFYTLLSAGLFVEAASRYWPHSNGYVVVARGCGQLLNFNSAFVLTLMLRNTITFLRGTILSRIINFDSYIAAHKVVGFVIFGCSIVHTIMHLANIGVLSTSTAFTYVQYLFTTAPGVGWVAGSAFITGDLLIIILLIMVICALPCIRSSGYFGVFFVTHQLYIAYIILLVLHGPSFWKWVVVPAFVLLIEVVLRLKCVNELRFGKTYLIDGKTLPSNVTHLVIKRPKQFKFKAGDYVFLNIPSVAGYEWHPFTISSPPEEREYIWLHIRAVGNWTKRLFRLIENVTNFKKTTRAVSSAKAGMRKFIKGKKAAKEREAEAETNKQQDGATKRQRKESVQRAIEASRMEAWSRKRSGSGTVQENVVSLLDRNKRGNGVAPMPTVISVDPVHDNPTSLKVKEDVIDIEKSSGASSIQVYLDGPYGAPATDIFNTDHAVLVAAGIGVTPFACILQSIMNRYTAAMVDCPNCRHEWMNELPKSIMQLKKVDFMWINRDQKAFDWFLSILAQLEAQQKKLQGGHLGKFLDIHLYLTSLLKKNDVKAIGLQMALDLMYEVENEDVITGLKTQMQAGRPDWDKLFKGFVEEGKGEVTVFYCGPPTLGDLLGEKCAQFGFDFKREVF